MTSGGGSGSGGSGSGGSGTYPYTYTCPGGYSDPVTIDVPNDSCSSQSERLAYTYGCNLIDDMPRACYNYYTCLGISSSEASATCGY
ncbi:MAG: hypothetical protein CMI13_06350 [Oleibacter sp.]|nr:hypothetical protein [Thalassolituus sp.]